MGKCTEQFKDAKRPEIVLEISVLKHDCGTKISRCAKMHRMIFGRETAGNYSRQRCIEGHLRNYQQQSWESAQNNLRTQSGQKLF